MVLSMKENGRMDKLLVKENSIIPMGMCMKVNGLIIRLMAMEHI